MKIRITDGRAIESQGGESLLTTLKNNGIYLIASCGGKGVCGKCRVRVIEGRVRTESTAKLKQEEIRQNMGLACKSFPKEDLLIEIPEDSRLVIGDKIALSKSQQLVDFLRSVEPVPTPAVLSIDLDLEPPTIENNISDLERLRNALEAQGIQAMRFSHSFALQLGRDLRDAGWKVRLRYADTLDAVALTPLIDRRRYGLAVDIGTTTVVVYVVDVADGNVVDVGMTYNSQMRHGDDVITRIVYATEGGGLHELRSAVVNDINDILAPIIERNRILRDDIDSMVIAGNTTMSQLFWGLNPAPIREEPYIPAMNSYPRWKAKTAKIHINQEAPVYTVPCVGSYVGGDIVAGVLASGMHRRPEAALFMDIGTNGEIAVGNDEWLITAACSAGPCFEGSGIRNGMRATEGAIESVRINPDNDEPELGVIGSASPTGICGSGMIDAISELFFSGLIDQKGKFARDAVTGRIRRGDEGPEYVLFRGEGRDILLTEVDIENILRAKAAIYAGVSTLLKEVGLTLDVVERIYIAGGFGNYLNIDKAVMIGMLPDLPKEKYTFIGNSSIAGAYLCLLSGKLRKEAEDLAAKMTYLELSVSRGFMDEYMSALFLPHTSIDLFPSVKERYNRASGR